MPRTCVWLICFLVGCSGLGAKRVPAPPADCVTLKASPEITRARCGLAIVQVMNSSAAREDILIEGIVEALLSGDRIDGDQEPVEPAKRRIGDALWTGRHFERVRGGKLIMQGDAFAHTDGGQSRVVLCMAPTAAGDSRRCDELVAYFGQYGASALPRPARDEEPSLPPALTQLRVPPGCRSPQGGTFGLVIRCSDGEFTWSRMADEASAKKFLGTTLEVQRRWLLDGLNESERPCVVAGVATTCSIVRGKSERGPMSAVFALARVGDELGIANCTYVGTGDELSRACAQGIQIGAL